MLRAGVPPDGPASVRPRTDAVEFEVVRIRHCPTFHLVGLLDPVRYSLPLRISDRILFRVEGQRQLLARVARSGPPHQRLDLPRLVLLENEKPALGPGHPGLVRRFRWLKD